MSAKVTKMFEEMYSWSQK